jgi:hypothetical protein
MLDLLAFSIFADDIREEKNEKGIIIGVYGNELRLQSPDPVPLGLFILTRILAPTDIKPFGIKKRVRIGEAILFDGEINPEQVSNMLSSQHVTANEAIAGGARPDRPFTLQLVVAVAVPPLTASAMLTAEIDTGNGLQQTGVLFIRKSSASTLEDGL